MEKITSIKDLVIQMLSNGSQVTFKANNGDPESCFQVGLTHLLGINTSVDFKKATKYLSNQSLSDDQDVNRLLGFISECEGDFSKAFHYYAQTEGSEKDSYLDKVIKGRNHIQDYLRKLDLPISLNKELSSILNDYLKNKTSRTGASIKIAAICNDEPTCLDAAKSLYEAKDYISAIEWLKRGNIGSENPMYLSINDKFKKAASDLLNSRVMQVVNLDSNSLLTKEDPTPFFNKVKKTCEESSVKCLTEWKEKTQSYIGNIIKVYKDEEQNAYLASLAEEAEAKKKKQIMYIIIGVIVFILMGILTMVMPSSDEESKGNEKIETKEVTSDNTEEVNSIEKNKPEDKENLKKYLEEILPLATKMGEREAVKKYFSKEFVDLYNRVEDYDRRNSGEIGFWNSDFWTDRQEGYIKKITVLSVSDITNNKAVVTIQLTIDDYNNNIDNDTRVLNMIFEKGKWLIDDYYDYKKNFRVYLSIENSKNSSSNNNLDNNGSFNNLSNRRLSEADLTGMSSKELEIMRNSIYARYGYKFKREDLLDYFSQYSWYNPTTSDMGAIYNQMNDNEKYNIDFIKKHE